MVKMYEPYKRLASALVFSIMPLGTKLSELEKGKADSLKSSGLSGSQIATKLNRSRTVICNYLKNPGKYGR